MERILKTPIKDLIGRFSAVGRILDEAGIGCVPCSVGTCLLGDIVEIHNLSPEGEEQLMGQIAAVVLPGETVSLPSVRKTPASGPRKISYSPPVKGLVEEHKVIKRFVALVPEMIREFDVETEEGRLLLLAGADFIQSYADRYHHAKEEEILFAFFDDGLDILRAMHDDHRRARACVMEFLEAVKQKNRERIGASLSGYASVLAEHIKKEDEILYPWMDRNLSTHQVGEMFARFRVVDDRFREKRKKYEAFVENLEKMIQTGRKEAIQ